MPNGNLPARRNQPPSRSQGRPAPGPSKPKEPKEAPEEKEKSIWQKILDGGLLAIALLVMAGIGLIVLLVFAVISLLPEGFLGRPSLSESIDAPFDCNVEYPANADEQAMANYINSIIPPRSPLSGLGINFVSTAKAGNKNPLFIAHFAQKESSWGTAGIATHKNPPTYNPFGRTAKPTQPHVEIRGKLWYKFNSWEDAVNKQGPYLKSVYQDNGLHTIQGIINKYCPPSECNTQAYIAEARTFISSHTQKSDGAFGVDPCVTVNLIGAGGPHSGSMTWPVPGYYTLSSTFHSPSRPTHNGIDIPAPKGTNIIAAADGVVEKIYQCPYNKNNIPRPIPKECIKDSINGIGVKINHQNGIKTAYLHFVPGSTTVQVGQSVKAGQVIGKVNNTGRSTGNHLHFGVEVDGIYVNPCGGFVKC